MDDGDDDDEPPAVVVVDRGARLWKAGFAGEEEIGALVAPNADTSVDGMWRNVFDELEVEPARSPCSSLSQPARRKHARPSPPCLWIRCARPFHHADA